MKNKWIKIEYLFVTMLLSSIASDSFAVKVKPLAESSFEEIINKYTFVNDFSQKSEYRNVSNELFWRYPFKISDVNFPIETSPDDIVKEFPSTKGDGRSVEHLNKARVAYLAKDYENAKILLLTNRSRYGKSSPYHRRTDYYIGQIFLSLAEESLKQANGNYKDAKTKSTFANASTFLSWAFIKKRDFKDDLVESLTPKGLYNLSSIYYKYQRYTGSHGTAEEGLNFLRKTGRKEYRSQFHRIVAESWIRNRSYLRAVQELDIAIRQDVSKESASAGFARVGDIYFDLNNYELAEDAYSLSIAIDRERKQINPGQLILRGESLFWLGKFSDAQRMLNYGIQSMNDPSSVADIPNDYMPWAKLRIADAYLARRSKLKNPKSVEAKNLLDKARLDYYRVETTYPKSEAAKVAKIRRACLELPYYLGKNIKHGRELLEKSKSFPLATQAIELSWACKVASYAERERTNSMLDRVREFSNRYPKSRFLKSLAKPVREVQASIFDKYIKKHKPHLATKFFERNRKLLFKNISLKRKINLFKSYVDIFDTKQAEEFWDEYNTSKDTTNKLVRSIVFTLEMYELTSRKQKQTKAKWKRLSKSLASDMMRGNHSLKISTKSKQWLDRIMATSLANYHIPWILKISNNWAKKDKQYKCGFSYPLYSRLTSEKLSRARRKTLQNKIIAEIDKELPALLEIDYECSQMLLEMEIQLLANNPRLLGNRWLDRENWPMVPRIMSFFWSVSELLVEKNEKRLAKKIWVILSKKGAAGSPEVKYSKIRLDPNKTEFEGLWE